MEYAILVFEFYIIRLPYFYLKLLEVVSYILEYLYFNSMGNRNTLCQGKPTQEIEVMKEVFKRPEKLQKHRRTEKFICENQMFFTKFSIIAIVLDQDTVFNEQIRDFIVKEQTIKTKVYVQKQKYGSFQSEPVQHIILNFQNGTFFMGQVKDSKYFGLGLLIDEDGRKYRGCFDNGEFSGYGQLQSFYPRRLYKGYWKNGLQDGDGAIYYEDGAKYEGQLQKGVKKGIGKLTFQDGSKYEGQFEDDLMNGDGTLTLFNGEEVTGIWNKGKYERKDYRTSRTFSINSFIPN